MLLLMLVAATTLRLCPLARAQPLCRIHTVRTGKVFHIREQVQGDHLYFSSGTTRLMKHPCKKNIALYLGRQVFLTKNSFESSLLPFSIPTSMQVGIPEVTSAHFAGSVLLLVVNQKVYVYDYEANSWNASTGVEHPVSHISGDNCCYSGNSFCMDISNSVFAYLHGDQISQANIYFSNTRGYRFQKYAQERQAELVGSLGGIFYFYSLSQVGLLLVDQRKAMFGYSDHPLNRSFGLPFDYNGTLDVLIAPGQKGILIFWFEKSLLVSRNAGQLVNPVQVREGQHILYSSISEANITIHSVAANENELAVLTQENHLYYGSLGILSSSLIKFADQNIWSKEAVLMFTDVGMLEILTPLPDSISPAFDFQKCPVNIQAILMDPQLQVDVCKVELLQGEFENKMYTIDMNSELELTALMIPRPSTSPVPLVMVSNPHSLGLQAVIYEDGHTYDGNTKHRLNISLRQQQHWGRADPNFTSSIKRPTISTITLDIANKEISCLDLKPLTALISVGCDLEKKIVIQNEISACYNGVLDPVALQDNYSYIIEREAYDPNFRGQKATEDLEVPYHYEKLGCPILVYYDTPWKPVVELWREGKFQEVVEAEYVLLEVNGLFTYTYSLTADMALCSSQPQNWTTIAKTAGDKGPFAWDRENYVSCHDPNNNAPLRWPEVPYQILGGPTENKVVFDQRNGIYIFFISIVDPYYSYCHLETTFSVYVYGAFPLPIFPPEITIVLLTGATLLSVWLAYMIPKLLHTEQGLRVKGFWVDTVSHMPALPPLSDLHPALAAAPQAPQLSACT
ncbi:cation channel sperm-associated auxiliary subunit delta [Balaenoptera acutorostrata]|uniref:Cation channel sperm-associated auxiliary subunit delta n=1 Tax=Balaenoptera acutorostrata TaxID=9767 RepID=A0ABM3T2X2_BALAC|nr:cation channel sperm-associated auxiliary subunit delta [Balaenoptera acutorostrata]